MKNWTIMVYLAGNNNLSDDMITAINGIKAGLSSSNKNIAVLAQYDCQHPTVPIHRYDFLENPSGEMVNDDFSSVGTSVYEFVSWCVKKQPAKRYALILSGHGDGFQGRTLLLDENSNKVLTLPDLRETIEDIKTFLLGNKKLDILGFDSCVMNTLEGVYEMRDLADIWVGSQGSIPNSGWAYENIIRGLAILDKNQIKNAEEVAKVFVNAFAEHSKNYSFGGRSVDISACKLSEVTNIAQNVDELSEALLSSLDESQNNLIKQTVERILLSSHWKSQTFMYDQTVDLRDFCENLQEECDQVQKNIFDIFAETQQTQIAKKLDKKMNNIYLACQRVVDSISVGRLIIKSAFSGADYQYSHGISLFFPWSYLTFEISQESYEKSEFVQEMGGNWRNFLLLYLSLTMRNPRNKEETKNNLFPVKRNLAITPNEQQNSSLCHRLDRPISRDNPPRSKDDPKRTRDNPRWSRSNPDSSSSSKSNPVWSRLNSPNKGLGKFPDYFGRTKNFPLNLTTFGGEE